MDDKIHHYIENLIPERPALFAEMEAFAAANHVPIMELVGIEGFLQLLRIQRPKRILEIGTAIGYSAMRMAEALPEAEIITLERDKERYDQARGYTGRFEGGDRIHILYGDALDIVSEAGAYGPFDAIFIDAAKGQYTKFFEGYSPFLTSSGVVYTDNVLFKGLVAEEEIEGKRARNLVRKISGYNEWLMSHSGYYTSIIPVGDGLAVSIKRGGK